MPAKFLQPDFEGGWEFGLKTAGGWQIRPSRAGQLNPNSPVQPWIANPVTNELHIGRRGTYHQDLINEHAPGMRREDLVTGVISRNGVETYEKTHPRAHAAGDALAYHMGIPHVTQEDQWAFASVKEDDWNLEPRQAGDTEDILKLLGIDGTSRPTPTPQPKPEPEERKTEAEWIQHEKENSWDRFNEVGERPDRVEWVPTSELLRYREYDRHPGVNDGGEYVSPQRYKALTDHISQQGVKSPLVLEYNHDKGTAHLGEGNHRLAIAEDLGIPHLPVRVNRSRRESAGEFPVNLKPQDDWYNHRGELWIPESMLPSHLGIHTVPGPTPKQASNEHWDVQESDFDPSQSAIQDYGYTHHPFMADPATNIVWIGPPGSHHIDLARHHQVGGGRKDPYSFESGAIDGGFIHPYVGCSDAVTDAVSKFTGHPLVPDKYSDDNFTFGKVAGDYDWDFEDDPDFQKLMPGSVDPHTAQPWKKGQYGKGYLTEDNQIHAWAVNGNQGAPHHQEVARATGHRPKDFFSIEPSGHVDTSFLHDEANRPILHDLLPKHKMIPGLPPHDEFSDADEFHFGNSFQWRNGFHDVGPDWHGNPTETEPWGPGVPGKGFIMPDNTLHTWATNHQDPEDGFPHHQDVMQSEGHKWDDALQPFHISPEGEVTTWSRIHPEGQKIIESTGHMKVTSPQEQWNFAKVAGGWTEHDLPAEMGLSNRHPSMHERSPFLIDHANQTIYHGPRGAFHREITQPPGVKINSENLSNGGWIMYDENDKPYEVDSWDERHPGVQDAVAHVRNSKGVQETPQDEWHFGALPAPEWQNGGHEHDTFSPYGDRTGFTLPWEPGKAGKGFLEPSGKVHTWATSHEHPIDGFPHHGHVMRPLGFEWHEGRQPFQIDPQGRVYTLLPSLYPETMNAISGIPGLRMKTQEETEAEWDDDYHFAGLQKEADKLNDFLNNPKSRPDLQTPEAQQFLGVLGQHYHNAATDQMLPWLTREWKKRRVTYAPDGMLQYQIPNQPAQTPLTPARLNTWADWYTSKHHTRQGVDLMQKKIHEVHDLHGQYAADAAIEEPIKPSGEVQHRLPNNWTIQKLMSPDALTEEGDRMGHCVGGYHAQVESGKTKVYSLRDDKNVPHVTLEVRPHGVSYALERPHETVFNARMNSPEGQAIMDEYAQTRTDRKRAQDDGVRASDPDWDRPEGYYDEYKSDILDELPRKMESIRRIGFGSNSGHEDLYRKLFPGPPIPPQGPHSGFVEQVQGQGNTIPKPEYQAMIKHWMNTIPEDQRPSWKTDSDNNLITDFDEIENPEELGGYTPHGDYGIPGAEDFQKEYNWDMILHSLGDQYHMHDVAESLKKELGDPAHLTPVAKHELADALEQKIKEYQTDHENEFEDMYFNGEYGHWKDDLDDDDVLDANGDYDYRAEDDLRDQHMSDARYQHDTHGDSWPRERANELEELRAYMHNYMPQAPRKLFGGWYL